MKLLLGLRLYSIAIFIVLTMILSCSVGDDKPPNTIEDLSVDQLVRLLEWTAPGDDGRSGKAALYFIRFFDNFQLEEILGVPSLDDVPPEVIQETVQTNFDDATQNQQFIEPLPSGSTECFPAPRLDITGQTQFFYAIRSSDEVGNQSQPSNVVELTTGLQSVKIEDPDISCPQGFSIGSGNFTNTQQDEDDGIIRNDIIIGDPCNGMAYIFFGQSDVSEGSPDNVLDVSSADVTIIGNAADQFGASVTGIGNFGGPGPSLSEIAIGAPGFNGNTGEVLIIFGNNEFPSVIDLTSGAQPDFTIAGENQGDNFGLVTVGFANIDMRGDEFFVGAPNALTNTGKAYRFNGNRLKGPNVSASDARGIIIGQSDGDLFGSDITDAGGTSGGSSGEYAIGSPGGGKAYVFFKNVTGTKDLSTDTSDVVIIQGSASDQFGASISGGGDIDEDGEGDSDLIVGAPGANVDTGSVFLYSGQDIDDALNTGTSPPVSNEFDGVVPGGQFGASVSVFDNLTPLVTTEQRSTAIVLVLEISNADFAVGAPGANGGTVYLFLGQDDFPQVVNASDADITLNADPSESSFGIAIADTGDVNGDLIGDFASSGTNFIEVEF